MIEDRTVHGTFRGDDWDLETLLRSKDDMGSTVSLVVPARNEAATVGQVVSRIRAELVEGAPLLDEIVVIDSDSTDETAEVAEEAGAVVHASREIRPDLGTYPGKGEAMWKSMFVTRGDLIVFLDADLLDWDARFVTGLLGPLLTTGASLVKGFYERSLGEGSSAYAGGRVTELVARPLIALDWPELGWLVQPLAGEWAVRRDLFERLSVPTGYAVELAALIDTHRLLGPTAIAQVDLGQRAHRPQPLRNLGAMAAQIIAASHRRSRDTTAGIQEIALHQHRKEGDLIRTDRRDVPLIERPPAREL